MPTKTESIFLIEFHKTYEIVITISEMNVSVYRETYTRRSIVDSDMLNRLQTEYDEFLLRVVNTLFTTHDRIGWQYLATLPFGTITSHTLWRLYQYLFHVNSGKYHLDK